MPSDSRTYYARRAGEYEQIYLKPERRAELARLRSIVARELAGHTVLEVACGTGYWTKALCRSAVRVVATDAVREVLEIARRKPLRAERVLFVQADAWHLPVVPGRFDGVFAGFWWSHLERTRVGEFLATLRDGVGRGVRCLVVDNLFVEGSSTPIERRDEAGNTYQLRRLADGSVHEVLKNFPSHIELGEAAAAVGDDVSVERLDYYWALTFTTR